MRDVLIRGVPEDIVLKLDLQAASAGLSRQEWLLAVLSQQATRPELRENYQLYAYTVTGLAHAIIERHGGQATIIFNQGVNDVGQAALACARELAQRNEAFDRERALTELQKVFDVAIELPSRR